MLYAGLTSVGVLGGSAALWRLLRDPQPSIAILPLMNSDSSLDYLSDGVTEDLINTLGQRLTLRVMSRAAVYRYKGSNPGPRELGRTLNIQFLLTGRVVQKGNNTLVAVELTDTRTGVHLWGQQYERPMSGNALQAGVASIPKRMSSIGKAATSGTNGHNKV
jgi:TolB-like protein